MPAQSSRHATRVTGVRSARRAITTLTWLPAARGSLSSPRRERKADSCGTLVGGGEDLLDGGAAEDDGVARAQDVEFAEHDVIGIVVLEKGDEGAELIRREARFAGGAGVVEVLRRRGGGCGGVRCG